METWEIWIQGMAKPTVLSIPETLEREREREREILMAPTKWRVVDLMSTKC